MNRSNIDAPFGSSISSAGGGGGTYVLKNNDNTPIIIAAGGNGNCKKSLLSTFGSGDNGSSDDGDVNSLTYIISSNFVGKVLSYTSTYFQDLFGGFGNGDSSINNEGRGGGLTLSSDLNKGYSYTYSSLSEVTRIEGNNNATGYCKITYIR